jgi:hypothetical protein
MRVYEFSSFTDDNIGFLATLGDHGPSILGNSSGTKLIYGEVSAAGNGRILREASNPKLYRVKTTAKSPWGQSTELGLPSHPREKSGAPVPGTMNHEDLMIQSVINGLWTNGRVKHLPNLFLTRTSPKTRRMLLVLGNEDRHSPLTRLFPMPQMQNAM